MFLELHLDSSWSALKTSRKTLQIELIVRMPTGESVAFVEEEARRVDMRVEDQDVAHQPLVAAILCGTEACEEQQPNAAREQYALLIAGFPLCMADALLRMSWGT